MWTDQTTEPDPMGPNTQIHGTSAFDGTHVWMAWNRPDGTSLFDVWLAAFACDGTLSMGPIEVTQSDDNEIDPTLSISGDRLLVAWASDNGTGVDNLDIRYRIFDLDGNPLTDAGDLSAMRNGVVVTGNTFEPAVTATDGGWMLAGAWGHEDAPGFQAFAVALDLDGNVMGEAEDGKLNVDAGQTAVSVAVSGSDTHLAWQEEPTGGDGPEVWSTAIGGSPVMLADPGGRPELLATDAGVWSAWDTDGFDVAVQPPSGSANPLSVPGSGFVHHPRLAAWDGQLSVLWMEAVSGIRNTAYIAPLTETGTRGNPTQLDTQDTPSVYPLDFTLVDATHAVVVYHEGMSPDFRLKAQWLTITR
jgi:hypothetical protein